MSDATRKRIKVGIVVSTISVAAVCLIGLVVVLFGAPILAIDKESALAWVPGAKSLGLTESYDLVVDYDKPLAELIADGHYGFVNENITTKTRPDLVILNLIFLLSLSKTKTKVLGLSSSPGKMI